MQVTSRYLLDLCCAGSPGNGGVHLRSAPFLPLIFTIFIVLIPAFFPSLFTESDPPQTFPPKYSGRTMEEQWSQVKAVSFFGLVSWLRAL